MTKLDTPEDVVASLPHINGHVPSVDVHAIIEDLMGGQAESHTRKEDTKGSTLVEGSVPPTPPVNAPAPSANSA